MQNKGSHQLKKIYFAKKFHKTVTPPPRRGFMKVYFFFGAIFWDIYNKKIEVWNPDDPLPPFVKLFRKIDFFLKDGFP